LATIYIREKEVAMNPYVYKLNRILTDFEGVTRSQKRFCLSVLKQVEANPAVFPTVDQAVIVGGIYRHYQKREGSDVEKQVLESLGIG
jgi:RNA polymerase-interacting CarD/CdnL/TRCF family regulator